MKKKIFILVVFLFSLFVLVGCGEPVEGPQGPAGAKGADGKSAYEVAVDNGFNGTEQQWLDSLHGEDGEDGLNGLNGTDGETGPAGKAAKEMELFAEDGGVYWRYVGEEEATLLYYYLDYVTVSYALPFDLSYADLVKQILADYKTITGKDSVSEWDHSKVNAFFTTNSDYDWLLRYFAETNPALTEFINHFLENGKVLAGLGQYIIRPYENGTKPEAASDSESDYALSTELAGFVAGDKGEGEIAVWDSCWKPANYAGSTEAGKANLDLLAKYAYEVVYSEEVKRNATAAYVPMDVEAADDDSEELAAVKAAIAAWVTDEYLFDCWADEEGEEVEEGIENHSTTLFAKRYLKTKVSVKPGTGAWVEDAVAAVFADFLAELNASEYAYADATTPHDLFGTYNDYKIYNFLVTDSKLETPHWIWLVKYLYSKNTYKTTMQTIINGTAELNTPADKYTACYELYNFFANESWKLHYEEDDELNGREIEFWKNNYSGLGDYLPAKYLVAGEAKEVIVAQGLPQPVSPLPFLGYYAEADANQALVKPEDMVMDGVYVARFLTAEEKAAADAIIAEFIGDVNTASGLTATAATFFTTYQFKLVGNGEDAASWTNEGGVFQAHPELVTKWSWFIELAHTGNLDNKRVLGACQAINVPYAYKGSSSAALDSHSASMFANNIHNLLNYSGATTHTGSASTYPASDWSDVAATVLAILAAKPAE